MIAISDRRQTRLIELLSFRQSMSFRYPVFLPSRYRPKTGGLFFTCRALLFHRSPDCHIYQVSGATIRLKIAGWLEQQLIPPVVCVCRPLILLMRGHFFER